MISDLQFPAEDRVRPRVTADGPGSGWDAPRASLRAIPVLITLLAFALAGMFAWGMWQTYMTAPWTRDGTVRAYVGAMAPEVAGRIVALPVADDQFVHKGDLLMVIDPRDFVNARDQAKGQLDLAEAQLRRANIAHEIAQTMFPAQLENAQAQLAAAKADQVKADADDRRYHNLPLGATTREQVDAVTAAADDAAALVMQADARVKEANVVQQNIAQSLQQANQEQAQMEVAKARLNQAELNLARTEIHSPVNGWVTNLTPRLGDYASVGTRVISIVDANSYWIDAYFEETSVASMHVGDPATVKLMGYPKVLRGYVTGIARGIDVANAQPNQQGLATVNPIFTWVRLAQRIPVRIAIDLVPKGVMLVAGMTATVQIEPGRNLR
jgi:multidrug resistance efflux pump